MEHGVQQVTGKNKGNMTTLLALDKTGNDRVRDLSRYGLQ